MFLYLEAAGTHEGEYMLLESVRSVPPCWERAALLGAWWHELLGRSEMSRGPRCARTRDDLQTRRGDVV